MRSSPHKIALSLSAAALFMCGTALAADRELTVYTYDSFVADWGPGPVIKEAFEARCDCTLNWVGIADGVALLNRLRLEGDSTRADVVLGLGTPLLCRSAPPFQSLLRVLIDARTVHHHDARVQLRVGQPGVGCFCEPVQS